MFLSLTLILGMHFAVLASKRKCSFKCTTNLVGASRIVLDSKSF